MSLIFFNCVKYGLLKRTIGFQVSSGQLEFAFVGVRQAQSFGCSCLWDKQWKSRRRCLDEFARGTSCGQICQTMPKAFPLLVRLRSFKKRERFQNFFLGTV